MLKFIELYKKSVAVIVAAIITVLAILAIGGGFKEHIDILILLLLAGVFVIDIILFFKGLPLALFFLTYLVFIIVGVVIGVTLKMAFPEADGFGKQVIEFAPILIIVFFVVGLSIPKLVKERVKERLYSRGEASEPKSEKETTAQSSRAAINAYSYFVMIRGANRVKSRPYTLSNLSPSQRRIRITIGSILMIVGISAFLTGAILSEDIETFAEVLKTPPFWLCIGGLFTVSFGAFLFVLGYIRTLISHVIVAGLAVLSVIGGYRMIEISKESVLKLVLIIVFLAILMVGIIIQTKRYFNRKNIYFNYRIYTKDEDLIAFDYTVNDLMPVEKYGMVTYGTIAFNMQNCNDKLVGLLTRIAAKSELRRYIFAGYKMENHGASTINLTFYIYSVGDCTDVFKKDFEKSGGELIKLDCIKDSEWMVYKNELAPDDYRVFTFHNQALSESLEKSGYDFTQPISIVYRLLFTEEEAVKECIEKVKENGYLYAQYESNIEYVENNQLDEKFSYVLHIQNSCLPGQEQLNAQIQRIMEFAERFNSELYDFYVGELEVLENSQ